MRQKVLILASLIGICGFFIYLSCCDDCPTCPADPVAGSYYVYIADTDLLDKNYIWIIDSQPDSIIDSIIIQPFIKEIDVSPNGEYLAAGHSSDSIFIYQVDTKEIISRIYTGARLSEVQPYFSNNNSELIVSSFFPLIPISKFDIFTGQLITSDTFEIELQGKTDSSPYIYGYKAYQDSLQFHIYDYNNMSLFKKFVVHRPDGSVISANEMKISHDERYAFFTAKPDKVFKYDLINDSILDSVSTIYNAYLGYMDCTSDEEYLLVTERGDILYTPEVGTLLIIDIETFETVRRICTYGYNPIHSTWPALLGKLVILPDGSRAYSVSNNGIGAYAPTSFNLINFTAGVPKNMRPGGEGQAVAIGKEIRKD